MSDVKRYVDKRMETDAEFADGFEVGYANFKIGVILRKPALNSTTNPLSFVVYRQSNTYQGSIKTIHLTLSAGIPLTYALDKPIWPIGYAFYNVSFVERKRWFHNLKIGMQSDKFECGLSWIVPIPVRLCTRCANQVLHDTVHGNNIRIQAHQWAIRLQFCKHVISCMVGIEQDHDDIIRLDGSSHLLNDTWISRTSL